MGESGIKTLHLPSQNPGSGYRMGDMERSHSSPAPHKMMRGEGAQVGGWGLANFGNLEPLVANFYVMPPQ